MRLADVHFETDDRAIIARLTGEIDLSNAHGLARSLAESTPNHAHALVVDLTGVDYLDSAGIQLIYDLRESLHARGQQLQLVILPTSAASDALQLAGVSRHVTTSTTVAGALRAIE